ncbi:hypothetical protein KBC79_00195 [Candidatus Woesebacteria bacterium]|nr:hypothetical protein [Candidatus Woesebacteria bacterium]
MNTQDLQALNVDEKGYLTYNLTRASTYQSDALAFTWMPERRELGEQIGYRPLVEIPTLEDRVFLIPAHNMLSGETPQQYAVRVLSTMRPFEDLMNVVHGGAIFPVFEGVCSDEQMTAWLADDYRVMVARKDLSPGMLFIANDCRPPYRFSEPFVVAVCDAGTTSIRASWLCGPEQWLAA